MKRTRTLRLPLALAAVALVGAHAASCSAPFDPPAYVNSLRVLAVQIDKPYANPGDTVTFRMTYADGRDLPADEQVAPILVTWVGGCFNPPGKSYYGCYETLGELFGGLSSGQLPPEIAIGPGLTEFSVVVPGDVLANIGEPDAGPKVALGFVFFLVCAGELRPVEQAGETAAGAFPIGCFDPSGRELGAEGFVPGYTQIYVFEDGRLNQNPTVNAFTVDGQVFAPDQTATARVCDVTPDERRQAGCAAIDEFTECETVTLDVDVPADVAEADPDALDADGKQLREVVWVSYFADGGDFESETKLVSDAAKGLQKGHDTKWVPPDEPGLYTLWAVVRDNRGGSQLVQQLVTVQ